MTDLLETTRPNRGGAVVSDPDAGSVRVASPLRFGRRRTGLIGVEIGEGCVRVAQAESTGRGFRIRAAETIERANPETELSGLGRAVRRVTRASEFAGNRVACLLPPAAYQSDVVPPMDDGGRISAESIHRRFARRNSSLSPSELVIDHWQVPSGGGDAGGETPFQVVAVARRTVEALAMEMRSAGLQTQFVDAPLTGVARAVRLFRRRQVPGMPENPWDMTLQVANALVIDWQQTTTSLTLVSRGAAVYSRSFRSTGFANMIDAVARGLEIAPQHAAVLLRDYGLPGPGQTTPQARIATTIFGVVREPLRRFREEIERSLSYFRRKGACGYPSCVLLTGSGSRVPHLDAWLSDELQIPRQSWQLPAEFCLAAALSAIPFEGATP